MSKIFILLSFYILFIPSTLANSCSILPNYIIDTEILTCKLVYSKESNTPQSVAVDVQVTDEIIFYPHRPISKDKHDFDGASLKGKRVSLIFKQSDYSCFSARIDKKSSKGKVFHASRLCCTAGDPWCPEGNHRGFVLPTHYNKQYPKNFDAKYDFNEEDILNMIN